MATRLEDFVELYDDVAKAKHRMQIFNQTPNDSDACNDAIKYTMLTTGIDPRAKGPRGELIELAPKQVAGILDTWYKGARGTATNYGNSKLEAILNDLDEKKLPSLLLNTQPVEGGSEVAKLHAEYIQLSVLLQKYKTGEDNEKAEVFGVMQKAIPAIVQEKIKQLRDTKKANGDNNVLDEEGIARWAETLGYIATTSPGLSERLFGERRVEIYEKIAQKLGANGIRSYIRESVKGLNTGISGALESFRTEKDADEKDKYKDKADELKAQRDAFYEGLYNAARAE